MIASDVGGIAEIVRDEFDGLIVRPGDEGELLAALRRMINDASFRRSIAAAGRAKIVGRFSDEQLIERSIAVYREILGRPA